MRRKSKYLNLPLAVAASAMLWAGSASAATLQILFSGMNWVYNGTTLCDAAGCAGSNGNPAESDPLITMVFLVDGVQVGPVILSDIWFDSSITTGALATAGTKTGSGGYFDILTQNAVPGWGLALDLNDWEIDTVANGAGLTISMGGTLIDATIFSQLLPFGLEIGNPVVVTFSSNTLTNLTSADGFLTGFNASGTGEINGEAVPEPGTLLLLGAGLLGFAVTRRKLG